LLVLKLGRSLGKLQVNGAGRFAHLKLSKTFLMLRKGDFLMNITQIGEGVNISNAPFVIRSFGFCHLDKIGLGTVLGSANTMTLNFAEGLSWVAIGDPISKRGT